VKFSEVSQKSPKELVTLENELREELFHLCIKSKTGQLEKKSQIQVVRHDLARIKTRMSELRREASGAKK